MWKVNLSFWVTDNPIPLEKLETAASFLVSVYNEFKRIYIGEGATYKVFVRRALRKLAAIEINYKIVPQSIQKIVEAHSRVHEVLYGYREQVVEALSRSSFGINDAERLLKLCESRSLRGAAVNKPDNPPKETYQNVAECANRYDLFNSTISGTQLIAFRDGLLSEPFKTHNMARAAFFFSLLAELKMLPRNWKHMAVTKPMLVYASSMKPPKLDYLYTIGQKNDASSYLAAIEPKFRMTFGKFYDRLTAEVKFAVLKM